MPFDNNRPVVLSFFDYTGVAVRPWAEAGYECHCFDLQHPGPVVELFRETGGSLWMRHADLAATSADWQAIIRKFEGRKVVMVFGFPPCTDLAVSGAKHFAAKLARDPLCQQRATDMAQRVAAVATTLNARYMVENPVSVLATLWRKPDHRFDPCDYGGYLPEDDQHPIWPEAIPARDAYTKKTCLWTGGGFVMPEPRPVEPVIVSYTKADGTVTTGSPQFGKLGGKSERTKNIRSATPRGFAHATWLANSDWNDFKALENAA